MTPLLNRNKEMSSPAGLSRRRVLGIFSISFISYLVNPWCFSHAITSQGDTASSPSHKLLKGEFKYFDAYQATIIDEVASLLIPKDEKPGAREAGVVFELDLAAGESETAKQIYSGGIQWLDFQAKTVHKKDSFLDLKPDEKMEILRMADAGRFPEMDHNRQVQIRNNDELAKMFFEVIKNHTFEIFYTSETGWKAVDYHGPPQWSGNRDYFRCF